MDINRRAPLKDGIFIPLNNKLDFPNMATEEILEYYSETFIRDIRDDLVFAASLIGDNKVAVDCGCGAGSDIEYLRNKGFIVHAFDIEEASIRLCEERFKSDEGVFLSQHSFSSYEYPKSDLVVADASLFFCPKQDFDDVWNKICRSINSGGIFCGSFLGPNDTMAGPDYDKEAFWPNVLVFRESQIRSKLNKFEVLRFTEHNVSGTTPQGVPNKWHIYSVVAKII